MGPESLRGVLFAALTVHVEAGTAGNLGPQGLADLEAEAEHHAARIEQEAEAGKVTKPGAVPKAVRRALVRTPGGLSDDTLD